MLYMPLPWPNGGPQQPPDFSGPWALAWYSYKQHSSPCSIASALVLAPTAHPFWAWHVVSLISLADMEDIPPATREFPDALYELSVLALSPDKPVVDPEDSACATFYMTPADIVLQFPDIGLPRAHDLFRRVLEGIVDGKLVPDSDWQAHWDETTKRYLARHKPAPQN